MIGESFGYWTRLKFALFDSKRPVPPPSTTTYEE